MAIAHLDIGDAAFAIAIVTATGFVSSFATRMLIAVLRRHDVLDRPNDRSSHAIPTPRGGGIAVIGAVIFAWLGVAAVGRVNSAVIAVCIAAALLAAVCWIDDLYELSPAPRLMAQGAAVGIGLLALPAAPSWERLSPLVYLLGTGLLWMWWVNLFNFMDGIDGIAGSEAAIISAGLLLFAAFGSGTDATVALLAAAILGASLGFLLWNWSPASIFLGDVGSAPLGFLIGYVLIGLAIAGRWKIASILPLYFFADATITLGRRALRGERIWQAHREHYYQQAIRHGLSHTAVVKRVIAANLLLVGCGWIAENGWDIISLAAPVIVAVLLAALAQGR